MFVIRLSHIVKFLAILLVTWLMMKIVERVEERARKFLYFLGVILSVILLIIMPWMLALSVLGSAR